MSTIIDELLSWHAGELSESTTQLLADVPAAGGHATRAILEKLLQEAFLAGAVAERMDPFLVGVDEAATTRAEMVCRLAERIAAGMFTNGFNQTAQRLVLELPGGGNGGGWSPAAARDQIIEILGRKGRA